MDTFTARLQRFKEGQLWHFHFSIDVEIAEALIDGKNRRVLCSINGGNEFQCAIMQGAGNHYFINLNKEIRTKHRLLENKAFEVALRKDKSEFGLPFPEEFKEVLDSDPDAKNHFDQLSPGRKRNLLYIVNKVKSIDKRIEKSLIIASHLKQQHGVIDFKQLNLDFRQGL